MYINNIQKYTRKYHQVRFTNVMLRQIDIKVTRKRIKLLFWLSYSLWNISIPDHVVGGSLIRNLINTAVYHIYTLDQ